MARKSTPIKKNTKTTVTKKRARRNGVSGTLVTKKTTGSGSGKSYDAAFKKSGYKSKKKFVKDAKAYNAKKKSSTFRPDAPKKAPTRPVKIKTTASRGKMVGKKIKTYGSGGLTADEIRAKKRKPTKRKVSKPKATVKYKKGRSKKVKRTSNRKLSCGVNSKSCKRR